MSLNTKNKTVIQFSQSWDRSERLQDAIQRKSWIEIALILSSEGNFENIAKEAFFEHAENSINGRIHIILSSDQDLVWEIQIPPNTKLFIHWWRLVDIETNACVVRVIKATAVKIESSESIHIKNTNWDIDISWNRWNVRISHTSWNWNIKRNAGDISVFWNTGTIKIENNPWKIELNWNCGKITTYQNWDVIISTNTWEITERTRRKFWDVLKE